RGSLGSLRGREVPRRAHEVQARQPPVRDPPVLCAPRTGRGPESRRPGLGQAVLPLARLRPDRDGRAIRELLVGTRERPVPPHDPRPARGGGRRPEGEGTRSPRALAPVLRGARGPPEGGPIDPPSSDDDARHRRFPLHEPYADLLRLRSGLLRTPERSAVRSPPAGVPEALRRR